MYIVCVIACTLYIYKDLYFTYRVLSYTYSMTYSSGFVIIIPDKTTINDISWHQMDTHVVLEIRLVGLLEVLRC